MKRIVRLVHVTAQKDVGLGPCSDGWKLLVAHPSRKGKNYYHVAIPGEFVVNALREAGVQISLSRRPNC